MVVEQYRNLVIGSGEGGKFLAWNLARQGQKTALVERSLIGGSCPNIACLPSKNVIHSAKAVSLVDPTTGLKVTTGPIHADMAGVARRKREMVEGLIELHLANFKSSGVELIMGEARFTEPKTIEVSPAAGPPRLLRGDRVFLCVGSRASIPDVPGLVAAEPMTHVEALELDRLPQHLVILGGGYIGLEFAQAMRRFGSQVTVVERSPRLVEHEDVDVSAALLDLMRDEGVEILLQAEILIVEGRSGDRVSLHVRLPEGARSVEGSHILVAAGRTPNTERLDVARAGIELDAHGFICVNDRRQTTAPDVWAMGDCAGSPQFTHVGYDDFRIVLSNLTGGDRTTRGRMIPYVLFTDPELARVGLSESAVKASGVPYRVFRIPASHVMRMRTLSQTRDFLKALVGADDRILGFTAFCAEASETLAAVQTAMIGGMPYTALRDALFSHPTASEGLVVLFTSGASHAEG